MKNLNAPFTVAATLLAALSFWSPRPLPPNLGLPQATPAHTTGTLNTTGAAVIRVQPDRVSLHLGVQTFGLTPRVSQAQNAATVERVLQAVRDHGIPAQDIATDYFALRPEYDAFDKGERKTVGYWTNNDILVTLREVDKLSSVLVAALEAGATSVEGVHFTTTRLRELRDQARTLAVKAALEKAHGLTGAADLSVGNVRSLNENAWSYYAGAWNSRGQWNANLQQNVMQVAASNQPPLEEGEFSLGQIVVQAQVDLTVEISN